MRGAGKARRGSYVKYYCTVAMVELSRGCPLDGKCVAWRGDSTLKNYKLSKRCQGQKSEDLLVSSATNVYIGPSKMGYST